MSVRFDAIWFVTTPLDMRSGMDTLLSIVVRTFGAAHPHHTYVFTNRARNRLKLLMFDDTGTWIAMRRLRQGQFIWDSKESVAIVSPELWTVLTRG